LTGPWRRSADAGGSAPESDTGALDTNVFVSSLLSPSGVNGKIVAGWKAGRFEICLSGLLFEEIEDVLARPHLQRAAKVEPAEIESLLDLIWIRAIMVRGPLLVVPVLKDDPDDDIILATALAANADVVVTGDHLLLSLDSYHDIPIITPRQFADSFL